MPHGSTVLEVLTDGTSNWSILVSYWNLQCRGNDHSKPLTRFCNMVIHNTRNGIYIRLSQNFHGVRVPYVSKPVGWTLRLAEN